MNTKTPSGRGSDQNLHDGPPMPGHSGRSGGNVARDVGTRDEEEKALGGDPEPTRATKSDKIQPKTATRSDHSGGRGE